MFWTQNSTLKRCYFERWWPPAPGCNWAFHFVTPNVALSLFKIRSPQSGLDSWWGEAMPFVSAQTSPYAGVDTLQAIWKNMTHTPSKSGIFFPQSMRKNLTLLPNPCKSFAVLWSMELFIWHFILSSYQHPQVQFSFFKF